MSIICTCPNGKERLFDKDCPIHKYSVEKNMPTIDRAFLQVCLCECDCKRCEHIPLATLVKENHPLSIVTNNEDGTVQYYDLVKHNGH